jgi:hypothetical protein
VSDCLHGPKKTSEPTRKQNRLPKKTANELYEEIKNSKTDAADIAKHNNLKPERIQKINRCSTVIGIIMPPWFCNPGVSEIINRAASIRQNNSGLRIAHP